MARIDLKYHELVNKILNTGYKYEDPNRKSVDRIQINDYKFKHDFTEGFPALTTKKLAWKSVVGELIWILRGDDDIKYLVDNNIPIWNKDACNYFNSRNTNNVLDVAHFTKQVKKQYIRGLVGRSYGSQLRRWHDNYTPSMGAYTGEHKTVDQLYILLNTLKTNPMATKKTVTFWNPAELEDTALTPCHWSFEVLVEPIKLEDRFNIISFINYEKYLEEFPNNTAEDCYCNEDQGCGYTYNDEYGACDVCENIDDINRQEEWLNDFDIPKYQFTLKWHQHSVDTYHGLPFNQASYALLAQMIGKMVNMKPKGIIADLSNVHIYEPHLDVVHQQMTRSVLKHDQCELEFHEEFEILAKAYRNETITLDEFISKLRIDMFKLKNYTSDSKLTTEMLSYSK